MKSNKILVIIIIPFLAAFLVSCGTSQKAIEKAIQKQLLNEQIQDFNFKFNATHAYPQILKPTHLSSYYDVRVSTDTVEAYLPYYGRAYTAPMDLSGGGIKFVSTDFIYQIEKGKKDGNWLISIRTNDTPRPFVLNFDLWDNGSGLLTVLDIDRQAISFQGNIEAQKEPE